MEFSLKLLPCELMMLLLLLPGPVSYTHLDVYKRQVSNKENVPPSINGPLKSELELDFDVLNFSNGDMKNEISWLNDFNYFDSPSLILSLIHI